MGADPVHVRQRHCVHPIRRQRYSAVVFGRGGAVGFGAGLLEVQGSDGAAAVRAACGAVRRGRVAGSDPIK